MLMRRLCICPAAHLWTQYKRHYQYSALILVQSDELMLSWPLRLPASLACVVTQLLNRGLPSKNYQFTTANYKQHCSPRDSLSCTFTTVTVGPETSRKPLNKPRSTCYIPCTFCLDRLEISVWRSSGLIFSTSVGDGTVLPADSLRLSRSRRLRLWEGFPHPQLSVPEYDTDL